MVRFNTLPARCFGTQLFVLLARLKIDHLRDKVFVEMTNQLTKLGDKYRRRNVVIDNDLTLHCLYIVYVSFVLTP